MTKCIANIPSVASGLECIDNQKQQQQSHSGQIPETTQEEQPVIEDLNIDAWARCVEDKDCHPEYLTVQNRKVLMTGLTSISRIPKNWVRQACSRCL